jgi:hypothetical protein
MEPSKLSESEVRRRAYELWQAEGCPDGHAEEFWHRACAELASTETGYDDALEHTFPASDPPAHSGTTGPKSRS